MSKRPGTHGDHSRFARRESPASGVPALVEEDDATDQYERQEIDESELAIRRDKRNPSDWLAKLQKKHDKLAEEATRRDAALEARMGRVEVTVANLAGTMEVLPDLVSTLRSSVDRLTARDDQTQRTQATLVEAEKLDTIDARKARRKFWLTVACTAVSSGGVAWLLHYLLHHFGVL